MSENAGSLSIKMDIDMSEFDAGVDTIQKKIDFLNKDIAKSDSVIKTDGGQA